MKPNVPLAPMTTLELGGPAEWFLDATSTEELIAGLRWAAEQGHDVSILGGGSNLVVPDEGVRGLVIRLSSRGIEVDGARVRVEAGEDWDAFVARSIDEGWAGLECLSGIPGYVGASPVQNVGAYGQDVSETIVEVGVLDPRTLQRHALRNDECAFAYRDSRFKRNPSEWIVVDVTFELRAGGAPTIRYAELQQCIGPNASLAQTRDTVIALRRRKSMVIDADDPNRRCAGSFFTNPFVTPEQASKLVADSIAEGLVQDESQVPRWIEGERVKLAAGWLIERAGFEKGMRRGHVGLSTAHALALVHHGGGTTTELLAFADAIRAGVRERFGVDLEREPRLLEPIRTA